MHGLSSTWLNAQQQRQLDGFRIPHPWISRASNKTILTRARQPPLSTQLQAQQLILMGRVARAPDSDRRGSLTFCPGSLKLAKLDGRDWSGPHNSCEWLEDCGQAGPGLRG
mmetsp:Transcript_92311/g.183285  ORF Transcript_92311/g.183285 Transcript_92311/m.183285 type:complete len:111 (-) Transcript_92311:211-543(-)